MKGDLTMNDTVIRVEEIAAVSYDEWLELAKEELDLLAAALEPLSAVEWAAATPCVGWDVRAMAAHLLGMMELGADRAELQRQVGEAARRLNERGGYRIDHLTALQVEEHAGLSTDELVNAIRETTPRAIAGRAAWTDEERAVAYDPGPPFGEQWTRGHLFGCIHTRDPWLHRTVDLTAATGRTPTLTADHDGRIIADVVAEWASLHGQPFVLELAGIAGGTYVAGADGEHLELDALEFCRILSGRAAGVGLLAVGVPF